MKDEKKTVQDIMTRLEQLKRARALWEVLWQEITEYLLPYFDIAVMKSPAIKGTAKASRVYNGNPISAAEFFANGLQGYLVSPNMTWFRTMMEAGELDDLPEVKEWLQELDKIMYSVFARTNFYSSINEFFQYGGTICTVPMYIEEDIQSGRLRFSPYHPYEVYIDVDPFNTVNTVYREFQLTAEQAADQFGIDELPLAIQTAARGRESSLFKFVHAVEPRRGRDVGKLDAKNKAWSSIYVSVEGDKIVRESGYDMMPFVVWRPKKSHVQVYGGGPGINALVDIRTVNLISKDMLSAAHLAVNPAYQAHSVQRGNVRLVPGAINYLENPQDSITPIHSPTQFPLGIDREEKIEEAIRKHFFVDFFIMLQQAERQMTATEIIERQGEKAAMLGPLVGNLNDDVLNPIFDIVFSKLVEAGEVPPPPPALMKRGGEDLIKIDYMGPLAQAQKKMFQTTGLMRGMEAIQGAAAMDPTLLDNVDLNEWVRQMLDSFNMPQKVIRPPEDVDKIRVARQQQIDAQNALATVGGLADAAGKANKRVEPGSMLDQIQKAGKA